MDMYPNPYVILLCLVPLLGLMTVVTKHILITLLAWLKLSPHIIYSSAGHIYVTLYHKKYKPPPTIDIHQEAQDTKHFQRKKTTRHNKSHYKAWGMIYYPLL